MADLREQIIHLLVQLVADLRFVEDRPVIQLADLHQKPILPLLPSRVEFLVDLQGSTIRLLQRLA